MPFRAAKWRAQESRHAGLSSMHTAPVADELTCEWRPDCEQPATYGVSLDGARYVPACWQCGLTAAVQLATVQSVELTPVDWAFGDDAPA
jgi:hypothetical protein